MLKVLKILKIFVAFQVCFIFWGNQPTTTKLYKFQSDEIKIIATEIKEKLSNQACCGKNCHVDVDAEQALLVDESVYVPIVFSPKKGSYSEGHEFPNQSVLEFARLNKEGGTWKIKISYNKITFDPIIDNVQAIAFRKLSPEESRIIVIFTGQYGASNFEPTVAFYKIDRENVCIYDSELSNIANEAVAQSVRDATRVVLRYLRDKRHN